MTKNPMLGLSNPITPDVLETMRGWSPEAAALAFDARLREIELNHKRTFVEVGIILCEAESRELWKYVAKKTGEGIAFHSLQDWCADAMPELSRTYAYAAWGAVKRLKEVPVSDMMQMSQANLKRLSECSPGGQTSAGDHRSGQDQDGAGICGRGQPAAS